jgi:hypothetical protein
MEVNGYFQASAALTPEKEARYSLDRTLGEPQIYEEVKDVARTGNRTLVVQLIAHLYTD